MKSLINITSVILVLVPMVVWATFSLSTPENIIIHDTYFRIGNLEIEPKNLAILLVISGLGLFFIGRTLSAKEKTAINEKKP